MSLNDLKSDDREIEIFKRFQHGFNPPANKPKIDFDVKNITLPQRKAHTNLSSSPAPGTVIFPSGAAAATLQTGSSGSGSSPFYSDATSMTGTGGSGSLDDNLGGASNVYDPNAALLQLLANNARIGSNFDGGGGAFGGNVTGLLQPNRSQQTIGGNNFVGNNAAMHSRTNSASGSQGSRTDSFIHSLLDGNDLKNGSVD